MFFPPRDLLLNNRVGMWAFALQRITGLLLTVYLIGHIFYALAPAGAGMEAFDQRILPLQVGWWHILDIALLLGIAFHALNGIRIIVVELGRNARVQLAWLYGTMVVAAILIVDGILRILPKMAHPGQ